MVTIFWDMISKSFVENTIFLDETVASIFSIKEWYLKTETGSSSKNVGSFYQTSHSKPYIPEYLNVHIYCP
jgi:hypothetical protein